MVNNMKNMKKNNGLWMMLGCAIPLIVILLLSAFDVNGSFRIVIFILLMFACHFFMMGGHHGKH